MIGQIGQILLDPECIPIRIKAKPFFINFDFHYNIILYVPILNILTLNKNTKTWTQTQLT